MQEAATLCLYCRVCWGKTIKSIGHRYMFASGEEWGKRSLDSVELLIVQDALHIVLLASYRIAFCNLRTNDFLIAIRNMNNILQTPKFYFRVFRDQRNSRKTKFNLNYCYTIIKTLN
jgi:hypothetical protein